MKITFNQDLIVPPFMSKDTKKRMLLDKDQVDMNTIIEIVFSLQSELNPRLIRYNIQL